MCNLIYNSISEIWCNKFISTIYISIPSSNIKNLGLINSNDIMNMHIDWSDFTPN